MTSKAQGLVTRDGEWVRFRFCAMIEEEMHASNARSRELERRLNAAEAIIRQQQLLDEEISGLRIRVKRLEEAGDGLADRFRYSPHADKWKAAKESKS